MFKATPERKAAIRKWYYEKVFFSDDTKVVPFVVGFLGADRDEEDGLLTELSFRRLSEEKAIQERFHSLQALGNMKLYLDLGNLERMDACGTYSFGGKILPHRDILEPSSLNAFKRPFVLDFDLKNRSCECKSDKTTCKICFKMGILENAKSIKKAVEKMDLVYEKDFLMFFSGSRGFHLYITEVSCTLMDSEQRTAMLEYISQESTVPITDARVSYDMKHTLRLPFSLHNETCLPVLPLFVEEIPVRSVDDLMKWSRFEENKQELKDQVMKWVEKVMLKG